MLTPHSPSSSPAGPTASRSRRRPARLVRSAASTASAATGVPAAARLVGTAGLAAVVALAGLVGSPAAADGSTTDVTVAGRLVVWADRPTRLSTYSLLTDTGQFIGLAADELFAGVEPNSSVLVSLRIDNDAWSRTGRPAPAPDEVLDGEAAAALARALDEPVVAESVRQTAAVLPPLQAGPAGHVADVVLFSDHQADPFLTARQLQTLITPVSDFWERESRGQVAGIRIGQVVAATYPTTDLCETEADPSNGIFEAAAQLAGSDVGAYQESPDRHLIILTPRSESAADCTLAGYSPMGKTSFDQGGVFVGRVDPNRLGLSASVMAHELGHGFGLGHAGATSLECAGQPYWDGPFSAPGFPVPGVCTVTMDDAYNDADNIMGGGVDGTSAGGVDIFPPVTLADQVINGFQKLLEGVVRQDVGLAMVTPTETEQIVSIAETREPDPATRQSILVTSQNDCGWQQHVIDYDALVGGVRVFRVTKPGIPDCTVASLLTLAYQGGAPDTLVLTTDSAGLQYLPIGQSRVVAPGDVVIRVLSAANGHAEVGIRQMAPTEPTDSTPSAPPSGPSVSPATPSAPSSSPTSPSAPSSSPTTPSEPLSPSATPSATSPSAPSVSPTTPSGPSASPASPPATTPTAASSSPTTPTAPSSSPTTPTAPSSSPTPSTPTTPGPTAAPTTSAVALTPSPLSLSLPPAAGSATIGVTVTPPDTVWRATSDQSWLTVPTGWRTGSGDLTVQVKDNNKRVLRQATVTLTGPGVSVRLTVQQAAGPASCPPPASLTLSQTLWRAGGGKDSVKIRPTSLTGQWTATAGAPWLRPATASGRNGGQVTIKAEANRTWWPRVGSVTFSDGPCSVQLLVVQRPGRW